MAKRLTERQLLSSKLELLTDSEVKELLNYVGIIESMRRSLIGPAAREDEVLAFLADAHENKRARQAFEWEVVRRRAEQRAVITRKDVA